MDAASEVTSMKGSPKDRVADRTAPQISDATSVRCERNTAVYSLRFGSGSARVRSDPRSGD
jgi:hypothetical protein